MRRLRSGLSRLSLSWCLLGGSLSLLRDLCSGLLWTGGYDLRCCLGWLSTGMSSLSLCRLGGCLGLLSDLCSGLLWTGGCDLWCGLCRLRTGLGWLSLGRLCRLWSWLCCGLWSLRLRGDDLWLCWGTCLLLRGRGNQLG